MNIEEIKALVFLCLSFIAGIGVGLIAYGNDVNIFASIGLSLLAAIFFFTLC
jgi:predicted tellurium resistance membrane protein TerC